MANQNEDGVIIPNFLPDNQLNEPEQEERRIIAALYDALDDDEPSAQDVETILQDAPVISIQLLQRFVRSSINNDMLLSDEGEEILHVILRNYPDIAKSKLGSRGSFLLHYVCGYSASLETVQLVMDLYPGALREKDSDGCLPLHWACNGEFSVPSLDVVKLLVSSYDGAGISVPTGDEGMLPLHLALSVGAPDKVVFFLLDAYPDGARTRNGYNDTPLSVAIEGAQTGGLCSAVLIRLIQMFPEALRIRDVHRLFPLQKLMSSQGLSLDLIRFFVEQWPESVRAKCSIGRLPLHFAAMYQPANVLQYLIEQNPDAVSTQDDTGTLPIHYACTYYVVNEKIQLLLDCYQGPESHHGGLSIVNQDGRVPLHYYATIAEAETEMLEHLIELYPEGIHVADSNGMLPLHSACDNHRLATIRTLVDADPFTVIRQTPNGSTPYHLAWRMNHNTENGRDTEEYLMEKQNEIVLLLKQTITEVADTQLGFPDLVIARVWSFAKPDLWQPGTEQVVMWEDAEEE